MGLPLNANRQKMLVSEVIIAPIEAIFLQTGRMQPMPTNDEPIAPYGPTCSRRDNIRTRLQVLLADLDILGETLAAIHVQTALDCVGKAWSDKDGTDERLTD
jgi:hypothetical protein